MHDKIKYKATQWKLWVLFPIWFPLAFVYTMAVAIWYVGSWFQIASEFLILNPLASVLRPLLEFIRKKE